MQGNSVGGGQKFYWGEMYFYQVKGTWGGVILMIRTFFKAKNSFPCIYNVRTEREWARSRYLLSVCRFYCFEIEISCSFLWMVEMERVIKKSIIFCGCHKWMTPYLPDINKPHLHFSSTGAIRSLPNIIGARPEYNVKF